LAATAGLRVPTATASDLETTVADLQSRVPVGEPIFVYPSSPLLYALAERPNPTRFDHLYPGAAQRDQVARVIADLESADVQVVVVSEFWLQVWTPTGPNVNAPLEAWLGSHFHAIAQHGAYRVLQRD
jgi:hypothetical protein